MKQNPGGTDSAWKASELLTQLPSLDADLQTDVCVVGGGISGMTTAYLLAREGRSVVVLDDGPIGSGETGITTAHLSNAFDDRYYEVKRLFGEFASRLVAESHTAAIDKIEEIVRDEEIECDFERLDGYLFVPPDCSKDILDREISAAQRAGLHDVEWGNRRQRPVSKSLIGARSTHGIQPSKVGTVRVMVLALTSWATSSTVQRTAI